MKTDRKRSLPLTFGIIVGLEIVVLILILEIVSILFVKSQVLKSNVESYKNLLDANITGLTYRNSKFMQQLRMYTMSDVMQNKKSTTEDIVEWLTAHEKIRGSDFNEIIYCDAATGLAYYDNGKVEDITNTQMYKEIMADNLKQYISDPVGTSSENSAYWVCKCIRSNEVVTGFFAGSVSHETLEKAVNATSVGAEGYAFLLAGDGNIMSFPPNPDYVMNPKATDIVFQMEGTREIFNSMLAKESSTGWIKNKGSDDLVVYAPVNGTPWSMALVIPEHQIYGTIYLLTRILRILGMVIVLILITSVSFSIYLALKPLKSLNGSITEIASGNADLTQRIQVKTNNEIGQVTSSFNIFVEKLQNIMKSIKDHKEDLNMAGLGMHDGIHENSVCINGILENITDVRDQIKNQADSVDETAAAVNEIASNIESLERMIQTQSMEVSQAGSAVEQMIGNINSVNSSVEKMAASFDILEQKAASGTVKQKEMGERIAVIEEQSATLQNANKIIASIASQTNLLAMNAAIEAAHAGEAGRGFSVVADEIRKLSETSTAQSKRIGEQLKLISESIKSVVVTSDDTRATFDSVSTSIKTTDEIVKLIKAAMEEQTTGSKQIVSALKEMSDSTAEVKSASAEMSMGNKTILNQIQSLKDATDLMKDSVSNMASGADKIEQTGSKLDGISDNMRKTILEIGEEIDSFKV